MSGWTVWALPPRHRSPETDCKGLPLPENVWSPRGDTAVNLFDMDATYGDVMDGEDVIAVFQRLPAAH
jgi:hypothetical protein